MLRKRVESDVQMRRPSDQYRRCIDVRRTLSSSYRLPIFTRDVRWTSIQRRSDVGKVWNPTSKWRPNATSFRPILTSDRRRMDVWMFTGWYELKKRKYFDDVFLTSKKIRPIIVSNGRLYGVLGRPKWTSNRPKWMSFGRLLDELLPTGWRE